MQNTVSLKCGHFGTTIFDTFNQVMNFDKIYNDMPKILKVPIHTIISQNYNSATKVCSDK